MKPKAAVALAIGLVVSSLVSGNTPVARATPSPSGGKGALPADTIEVPSTPLEVTAVGFARAFASASADELSRLMAPAGIRLQIEGSGRGGLSPRQAVASILEFIRRYEGGRAVVNRAEPLSGSPDRGFAEVLWSARAAGTSDQLGLAIFLGLARDGEEWRVDEIRLLQ